MSLFHRHHWIEVDRQYMDGVKTMQSMAFGGTIHTAPVRRETYVSFKCETCPKFCQETLPGHVIGAY